MESIFYHTYNRGVEKRRIFLEDIDYLRCVHDLYEFNDKNIIINLKRRFEGNQIEGNRIPFNEPIIIEKPREKLLDIIVWSLMPNHYHLFSTPIIENGISKFHQKFGIGFSNYFNTKYKRNGVLFQGKYKKVKVLDDRQMAQLVCYIHSNPLDLWKPGWKENGLSGSEIQSALKFLEKEYRWSSHLDYLGIKNFPSLIGNNEFLINFFGGPKGYLEFFIDWLRYYEKNIDSVKKLILD